MKKSLLAIAVISAFASAAQAQSSVTVYGIVDVGIMGETHSGNLNSTPAIVSSGVAGSASNSATGGSGIHNGTAVGGMAGGESQSRIGFKGSEDLGSGTKAIFTLETGFNAMTGNIANTGIPGNNQRSLQVSGDSALQGQLFGRAAYAGLSNDKYGTLTAGRQQNLMLDNIPDYDPVNAQMFSPLAYAGSWGGAGFTDQSRVNQSFKYVWKGAGFNANALWAPGGQAGNNYMGTTVGAQAGYEKPTYGVQAIYTHTDDATSLAAMGNQASAPSYGAGYSAPTQAIGSFNAVGVTVANTSSWQFTGKWNPMSSFWLKGGYERIVIGTPTNFAGNYTTTNMPQLPSGYVVGSYSAQGFQKNINMYWIGANYNFTPAIKGSLGYYIAGIPSNGNTAISQTGGFGSTAGGAAGGNQMFTSAMVEYYMSKRTNLYAAFMNTNATGGQNLYNTTCPSCSASQTYGLGMRHSF